MYHPPPTHDVWIVILDHLEYCEWSQLKECNVVCRAWHAYLQPLLMAAISINEINHPTSEDLHVIQQNVRFIQQLALCYDTWNPSQWLDTIIGISPSFTSLVTLKLSHITFSTVEELQSCISAMSESLEGLIIFNCACSDVMIAREDRRVLLSHPHNRPALRKMQIDSEQEGYFAFALWDWLSATPTLSVLRVLDIRLYPHDAEDLRDLFAFMGRSECAVEELKLTMGDWSDDHVNLGMNVYHFRYFVLLTEYLP
jgi:hypothetical protein